MGPNRRRPLQFEPLEGKLLLSTASIPRAAIEARGETALQSTPTLDGSLVGARSSLQGVDRSKDGTSVSYTFSGKVSGLGLVRATYVQTSKAAGVSGSITLSNKAGTVRLTFAEKDRVTDVTAATHSAATYHYQVATATKAFAGLQGDGVFTLGSTILRPHAVTLDIRGISRP